MASAPVSNLFNDAFISYGRADSKVFAGQLQRRLVEAGFKVWFDFNDIPLGVDYQIQIDEGIAKADNFLFIIAPHSVNSPYCLKEIELAIQLNKRIIPLLHVEQISWETWQQRHPGKSEAEWQAYQQQGLHSSFPKMHPGISKINWVYLREGMDDFEAGFSGLTDLLMRHRDYVQQHTVLLNQAIVWERQQKQTRHLLVGEQRQAAEAWLKYRFQAEQAPCEPTLLHCELICESIKNANNLMTQVFLCYAEVDSGVMTQIRAILLREGITVWTNKTDIQTGETFEEAIDRGIEQADTIVYLLSPEALESQFCQHELDYALEFNKRIIPLLIRPTDLEQVPAWLQSLQFINFTDNSSEADLQQDFAQLLRSLQEDSSYYEEHKILLTKALKWERQSRNPTILLRGHNLRNGEAWLKGAQQRTQYLPTTLQATFIAESWRQPPASSLDVFLSYSRSDSELARRLNDELQLRGKTTWFDQESIASGSDFQQEIERGIECPDNFLFILSPRSVNSPYCADEVEYAAKLNKRFVTLRYQTVNPTELHPELAKVQWIDFSQGDFYANLNQLVRTLETDREHVQNHTKWLQRAIEWQHHGQSSDLLLRGSEFAIAETWLQEAQQTQKQPPATDGQIRFIQASHAAIQSHTRQEQQRLLRLRLLLGGMTVVAGVAVVATIVAFSSQQTAVKSQQAATQGEIKALTETSNAQFSLGREFDALLSSLRAAKKLQEQGGVGDSTLQTRVLAALQQSVYAVKEKNRLENFKGSVSNVIFSPNGQIMATADDEGVKLWRTDGTFLTKLDDPTFAAWGTTLDFSPDGQTIATFASNGGRKNVVKVWGLDGKLRSQFQGKEGFKTAQFSPDHQTVATFDGTTIQLWQRDGKAIATLEGSDADHFSVWFSQDGQTVGSTALSSNADKQSVKFWRRNGSFISSFETEKSLVPLALNRDGSLLVMSDDKTLNLYQPDGSVLAPLVETADLNTSLSKVQFSPDDQTIAASYNDNNGGKGIVKLWQRNGQLRATLTGQEGWIQALKFSPDSQRVATAGAEKTVKIWNLDGKLITTLVGHGDWVSAIEFNPKNKTLASASYDGTLRLWGSDNSLLQKWNSDQAVFSKNKQVFATATQNGPVALWKMDGTSIATLIPKSEGLANIQLSRDGTTILTALKNSDSYGPVQLWNGDGTLVKTLIEKTQKLEGQASIDGNLTLSDDGKTIVTSLSDRDSYGPVQLWNGDGTLIKTLLEKTQKSKDQGGETSVNISLSRNGKTIVTSLGDRDSYGPVQLWNGDGTLVKTLIEKTQKPRDQFSWVNVSLSPDGKTIVTNLRSAGSYGPVKLWDHKGTLRATLMAAIEPNQKNLFSNTVEFSQDSQTLLTVANGLDSHSVVKLWRSDGTLLKTLVDLPKIAGSVTASFSQKDDSIDPQKTPDRIITAIPRGALQLWNPDGSLVHTVTQKLDADEQVYSRTLSPDGQILAVGVNQKKVQIWDVKGQLLKTISHEGFAISPRFSANSQMFVSGSFDNTAKLWDRHTNSVVPLTGHTSGVTQLNFDPTSQHLASASEKGRVILFPLDGLMDLPTWFRRGCDHLSDYLQTSANADDRLLCEGVEKKNNNRERLQTPEP